VSSLTNFFQLFCFYLFTVYNSSKKKKLSTVYKEREMLTCALKAQVKESNIKIMYWNVCISFNL
jgi:hypothetical protein